MVKKLEIITNVSYEGRKIGEVSVMYQREQKNFEIKKIFSDESEFVKTEKKMESTLRQYDAILDNFTKHGFQISHEMFKGYLSGCGYKSKYSPFLKRHKS